MNKTPDEIKKGLECRVRSYTDTCDHQCDTCDLRIPAYSIFERYEDAPALIQQLEAELEDMTARYKIADDCAKKKGEMNEKLYAELTAVKAERDSAVADMTSIVGFQCGVCKHYLKDAHKEPCNSCRKIRKGEESHFEWRGVTK